MTWIRVCAGFALPLSVAALALACHHEPALLSVRFERNGDGTRLLLLGAPGVQINARLKPALELDDGSVLRFDSPDLTPDSSYFRAPPELLLPGVREPVHGHLRASICPEGANVCRPIELEL